MRARAMAWVLVFTLLGYGSAAGQVIDDSSPPEPGSEDEPEREKLDELLENSDQVFLGCVTKVRRLTTRGNAFFSKSSGLFEIKPVRNLKGVYDRHLTMYWSRSNDDVGDTMGYMPSRGDLYVIQMDLGAIYASRAARVDGVPQGLRC